MKSGDLVQISRLTRWGGIISTGKTGILVEKHYTAYSKEFSKWKVLIDGKIEVMLESKLRVVQASQ